MSYFVLRGASKRTKTFTSLALAFLMISQTIGPGVFALRTALAVDQTSPYGNDPISKVDVCHYDNGQGGKYTDNNVSVSSSGAPQGGHEHHSNDIIPPYFWSNGDTTGFYPGSSNWLSTIDGFSGTGEQIWNDGGCNGPAHPPQECVATADVVLSDTSTQVTSIDPTDANILPEDAVPVTPTGVTTSAWTASIPGATWIWSEAGVSGWNADKTVTFVKTFTVTGTPTSGTLLLAADNTYTVDLNGTTIEASGADGTFGTGPVSYNVAGALQTGNNTLTILVTNTGTDAISPIHNPGGLLYSLSWNSDCGDGNGGPQDTLFHTVTFHKFIDGKSATANSNFTINWGIDDLSNNVVLSSPTFTASTNAIVQDSNVNWSEVVNGEGNDTVQFDHCAPGKFFLDGYSWGDTLELASSTAISANTSISALANDAHVIVWNKSCPSHSATLIATKIMCETEADLPNWGDGLNGAPSKIDATTATDFVANSDGKCHLEPDWQFETTFRGPNSSVDNPTSSGTDVGLQGAPWTPMPNVTDANGITKIDFDINNTWHLWVREVLQDGFVTFSGGPSDVSAEMYCDTDITNYDNLELLNSPFQAGANYYCVAFNAQVENHENPSTVKVTIVKFVDGLLATAQTALNNAFPMVSSWSAVNIGAGSGSYTLSPVGFNSPNAYEAVTSDMTTGADYATSEDLNGSLVGKSCQDQKSYALAGYTYGDTYGQAAAGTPTTTSPSFTNLSGDKVVIVWNNTCSRDGGGGNPTGNLIVTKIVDNGQSSTPKVVSDFPLFVDAGLVISGATTTVSVGSHVVSETGDAHYSAAFSGGCDVNGNVTVTEGGTAECTITNTYIPVVLIDGCTVNCGGGGGGPQDIACVGNCGGGGGRSGSSHSGISGGGSNGGGGGSPQGEVLGATAEAPGLPDTGNGASSDTIVVGLALLIGLFAVNTAGLKLIGKNR